MKTLIFKELCFLNNVPNFCRLFIILVSLTMTLFREKMLISHKCILGLMPNLIKKAWTVYIVNTQYPFINYLRQKCSAAKRSKRAKSSLRSRISSSAVHWADNEVNPQISANKMLKKRENIRLKKYKSLFLS